MEPDLSNLTVLGKKIKIFRLIKKEGNICVNLIFSIPP